MGIPHTFNQTFKILTMNILNIHNGDTKHIHNNITQSKLVIKVAFQGYAYVRNSKILQLEVVVVLEFSKETHSAKHFKYVALAIETPILNSSTQYYRSTIRKYRLQKFNSLYLINTLPTSANIWTARKISAQTPSQLTYLSECS